MMNQSQKVLKEQNGKLEKVLLIFLQVLHSLELTLNSHFQVLPYINSSKKPVSDKLSKSCSDRWL